MVPLESFSGIVISSITQWGITASQYSSADTIYKCLLIYSLSAVKGSGVMFVFQLCLNTVMSD